MDAEGRREDGEEDDEEEEWVLIIPTRHGKGDFFDAYY